MNKQFTCLLIEDDHDDQEIFLTALRDAYPRSECWVAENCFQALDRMKSRLAPIPEYIFMDWNLPLMDGTECVRQIRDSGLGNVCIFVLTGTQPPVSVEMLNRLGIEKVLTKKASIRELIQELHRVIQAG